jgi:hypothetical protein
VLPAYADGCSFRDKRQPGRVVVKDADEPHYQEDLAVLSEYLVYREASDGDWIVVGR